MGRTFTKADWDRYAECYDNLEQLHPYSEMLDDVVKTLRNTHGTVLDAGCGTGNLIARLAPRITGPIIGVDGSAAMLERARMKCPDGTFVETNLDAPLPFREDMFDTIACVNTLYALENTTHVLQEFFRLLRPGGRLVLTTPKYGYENGLILKAYCGSLKPDSYWQNAHASTVRERSLVREAIADEMFASQILGIARFNRRIARERTFRFFTASELSKLVRKSGFIRLSVGTTYAGQNLLLVATRSENEWRRS